MVRMHHKHSHIWAMIIYFKQHRLYNSKVQVWMSGTVPPLAPMPSLRAKGKFYKFIRSIIRALIKYMY